MDAHYFTVWLYWNLFSHLMADGQYMIYWSLVLEEESGWEFSDLTAKLCCPHLSSSSPCPQVSTQVCWYLEFWLFPSNLNPHGSQYVILMGSEAFKNGIQTFWSVSKEDDFLLNGINPTNPVWNLINRSDKRRKCCFLCEMDQAFYSKMCLLLIRSSEMREGQFPGVLIGWGQVKEVVLTKRGSRAWLWTAFLAEVWGSFPEPGVFSCIQKAMTTLPVCLKLLL